LSQYTGNVAPNDRLGIPPITMNDGPQGTLRYALLWGVSWPRAGFAGTASCVVAGAVFLV
jgi:hypothetical protein